SASDAGRSGGAHRGRPPLGGGDQRGRRPHVQAGAAGVCAGAGPAGAPGGGDRLRVVGLLGRAGGEGLRLPGRVGEPAAGAAGRAGPHAGPGGGRSYRAGSGPRALRGSAWSWTQRRSEEAEAMDFDLVVIGAGTAGSNAAKTALGLGARTAIIEQD